MISGMDEVNLDYFQTVIEELLDEVDGELKRIGDATRPISPDVSIGRLSRLDSMQMQQMALEQKRQLESKRNRLHAALERIGKGTYGMCSSCREEIDFSRLRSQPETMVCSRCAAGL